MAKTLTVSRQKPKIVAWGRPSLEPGVERYVLNGGGTGVYALESDDVIEIALLEGAQTVEMLSFGANGKSNLASLGLTGRGSATDIQKILADDSDDAARVRFGLFRRGMHVGRTSAARLFGREAPQRLEILIKIASAESFEVAEGEFIQIIDLRGRQCSDFLAFHRRALDQGTVLGLST